MAKLLWWVDLCSESLVWPQQVRPASPSSSYTAHPALSPSCFPLGRGGSGAGEKQRHLVCCHSLLALIDKVVLSQIHLSLCEPLKKPPMVTINVCDWRFAVLLDLCGKKSSYEGKTSSSLIRKFYYAPGSPRYIFFPKKSFENIYIFVRQGLCLEDCEEAGDSDGC